MGRYVTSVVSLSSTFDYRLQFLIPWARLGKCRHEVYDPKATEKLWSWLEDAVKPNIA